MKTPLILELLIVILQANPKQSDWCEKLLSPLILNWPLVVVAIVGIWVAVRALKPAEAAAQAAKKSADALINSERAWAIAKLSLFENGLPIVNIAHKSPDSSAEFTEARVKLTCKNVGKSPAWIDGIFGRMDIVTSVPDADVPLRSKLSRIGTMEPIGPDAEGFTMLELHCAGCRTNDEFLSLYVIIEYHDIFNIKRLTTVGYTIQNNMIFRQEGLPDRNRNT